ncbi:UNVERIFIED_ORG: PepSY domain-containing protein [Shinella sp. XGS7]|nr:PepSY domain-containing protein [Shinella sp. XGS7]
MKTPRHSAPLLALGFGLLTLSHAALAGPSCQVPPERWMKEADFRKTVEAQGYQIKTLKVSKGRCYEIYGQDAAGHKVEIYFDPATAAVLERK